MKNYILSLAVFLTAIILLGVGKTAIERTPVQIGVEQLAVAPPGTAVQTPVLTADFQTIETANATVTADPVFIEVAQSVTTDTAGDSTPTPSERCRRQYSYAILPTNPSLATLYPSDTPPNRKRA